MRFKTDENLHEEVAQLLRQAGHDAATVWDQGMQGCADAEVAEACRREGRTLVTLDLDFSDLRAYPPSDSAGLVIIRMNVPSRCRIVETVRRILPMLATEPLAGRLWIVDREGTRIRIRGTPE